MKNQPEDSKGNFIFTETHGTAIKWLFTNIVTWYTSNNQLFLDLFYNRDKEMRHFSSMLQHAKEEYDHKNILITGRSGIGKTSFLYRIIGDTTFCSSIGIKPILVDYSASVPMDWTGCLFNFVNEAEKAFEEIGHPINTLRPNHEVQNIDANVQMIKNHLDYLAVQGAL